MRKERLLLIYIYQLSLWSLSTLGKDIYSMTRKEVLNHLLNSSVYDASIAPDYELDTPTNVTLQVFILSIDSVNEQSMDFTVNMFLRQSWIDPRLQFLNHSRSEWLELDVKLIEKVWVPDTFFSNEKSGGFHELTVPNKLMHVYRNGTVIYSVRISMTLSCYMKLEKYPMDKQTCPMIIESYSYTVDNVIFNWNPTEAIQIGEVEMPQFTIDPPPTHSECEKDYASNARASVGRFACLKAIISLQRNVGYYIVQIYIPSILIVMLSWVSFWLDLEAVPARISLGVLTVLTMTTQSSGAHSALPRVSYVKAIDVWMATCLFFVFAGLLEFAYVNVLTRRRLLVGVRTDIPITDNGISLKEMNDTVAETEPLVNYTEMRRNARRVDKIARIVFPMCFLGFNIGFWTYYNYLHTEDG